MSIVPRSSAPACPRANRNPTSRADGLPRDIACSCTSRIAAKSCCESLWEKGSVNVSSSNRSTPSA